MFLNRGLILAGVLLGIALLATVYGVDVLDEIGCKPCPEGIVCPKPRSRTCELVRRTCGCCDECAGRKRQHCNATTVRCDSRFVCVDKDGFGMINIPFDSKFNGVCKKKARKGIKPVPLKMSSRFVYVGGKK